MPSNPALPPAPVAPPPMGATAISSPPLRRRARDPDDDADDALEEGELRVPVAVPEFSASETEDDGDGDNGVGRRYEFHRPRVVVENAAVDDPAPEECESDATLSDDGAVGRGWADTGRLGRLEAGAGDDDDSRSKKRPSWVMFSDSEESDLDTGSAGEGIVQAAGTGTITSIIIPHAAAAAAAAALHHHHQPQPTLLPKQEAHQPPRAPQQPPPAPRRARQQRATEYTCQVCGKSYPTHQALGGHAAGHRSKQREAEAMAAAMAAAAAGGASLDAAFPFPLHRGGKAGRPHECRHCGKVFGTGVALGGHMRVHYTGPPIVPARKNKKRCLAPPPPTTQAEAAPPVGLSLGLSIKAEENMNIAAARATPAVAAVGLSLGLSVKAEEEPPSTPPATPPAGGAVGMVRLFGINISPHGQQAPLQQQQGSGDTTAEDSSSTGQEQH